MYEDPRVIMGKRVSQITLTFSVPCISFRTVLST